MNRPINNCTADLCGNGPDDEDNGLCDFCDSPADIVGAIAGEFHHLCEGCQRASICPVCEDEMHEDSSRRFPVLCPTRDEMVCAPCAEALAAA